MSFVLFKHGAKSSFKLVLIFLAILTLYSSIIVTMYDPDLSASLEALMEAMPDMFEALNMDQTGNTLLEFVSNYLYSFLLIAFPLIYICIASIGLVVKYVDRGSIAYILSMPISRLKIITTQAFVMLSGVIVIVLYVATLMGVMAQIVFPGQLNTKEFIMLNVGWLGLLMFFSGLCFFASCIFNDAKNSTILGSGLSVLFVLINMAANTNEELEFLYSLTPITLFNQAGIISGDNGAIISFIILYVIGIILYVLGGAIFCRRDIHV